MKQALGPSSSELVTILVLTALGLIAVKWSAARSEPGMCALAMADPAHASRETLEDCEARPTD